jgi:citrate lyase subunit beta/citryl-CoA lyase
MSADVLPSAGIRSLLFAPASNRAMLDGLSRRGADAVAVDLEDAVAESEKLFARDNAVEYVKRAAGGTTTVRINPIDSRWGREDLEAVVAPGLDAVVVPKVERVEELTLVAQLISMREVDTGMEPGTVRILAMVETAPAVLAAESIAKSSERLLTLVLGSGDLVATVGLGSLGGPEMYYARSRVVFAAAAGGLAPPLDGPYLKFRDAEGLRFDSRRSRAFGFSGRVVVHPEQLAPVHEAYSVPDDIDHLRAIVVAFEKAERQGNAAIDVGGEFVDYPIYNLARRRLSELEREVTV